MINNSEYLLSMYNALHILQTSILFLSLEVVLSHIIQQDNKALRNKVI